MSSNPKHSAQTYALVDRVIEGACPDRRDMALAVGLAGMSLAYAWEYALTLGPEHADTAHRLMLALTAVDPLRTTLSADALGLPFSPRAAL